MMDDESYVGEMNGKGETKQQWGSGENKEETLEIPGKGEFLRWDQKRKPKEFNGLIDRKGKETPKHFRTATLDGFDNLKGKSVAERHHRGITKLRNKYGILVLPNGKFTILRGNGLQGLGQMMIGRDRINMRSASRQIGLLRKSSEDELESLETAANAIPRYGTLGSIAGPAADTGDREKPDTPGVTFEGGAGSLDGFPINKDKIKSKGKLLTSDTNEGRFNGMANNQYLGHVPKIKDIDSRLYTDRANSKMSEQWVGTLKANSTATLGGNSLSTTNASLQEKKITRKPLVIRPSGKVGSKLVKIKGRSKGFLQTACIVKPKKSNFQ